MGAQAWRVHQLGSPKDALALDTVSPRDPGPAEVQVAVGAVGLNFPDLLLCSGHYQQRPELPFAPGFEAAGTVRTAGPESRWQVGQRVLVVTELPNGAFQQTLTVGDDQLHPVPDAMPMTTAATFHIAYQTAHAALHRRGRLAAGETVLVTGGAGGVGLAAVQLARAAGAHVIATAGGEEKTRACSRHGADIAIDTSADADLRQQVRDATDGRGVDVAIDVIGGETFDVLRRCMAFEGRLVVVGFAAGNIASAPTNHMLLRNYAVLGLNLMRYRELQPDLLRVTHDQLLSLYADGSIAPEIYQEMPFAEAPAALDLLTRRTAIGRVALCVPSD